MGAQQSIRQPSHLPLPQQVPGHPSLLPLQPAGVVTKDEGLCLQSADCARREAPATSTRLAQDLFPKLEPLGNVHHNAEHSVVLKSIFGDAKFVARGSRLSSGSSKRSVQVAATSPACSILPRKSAGNSATFAQRLRRSTRSALFSKRTIERKSPQKRRRRQAYGEYPRRADDDSSDDQDDFCECAFFLRLLLNSCADEARSIQFTTHGICVQFEGLQHCRDHIVPLSETVAMVLAGGVEPQSCFALQSCRLALFGRAEVYQLQRSCTGWLLVAVRCSASDASACFNFVLRRWQPLTMMTHGPYAPAADLLYLAFVPQKLCGPVHSRPTLFVKLGFRELVRGENSDHDSLIGYIEKKSDTLQLTNVAGAGLFVFEVPQNHHIFARPGRAAEASLKTELLHCSELSVTPSGHCGEVGSFSASLEYFFIEESKVHTGPLAALTRLLRSFTGNPSLLPQRAVAFDSGGLRRGRKHLQQWPRTLDVGDASESSCGDADCGYRAPLRVIDNAASTMPSPSKHLRSRAKRAQLGGRVAHKPLVKHGRSRMTC